MKYAMWIEAVTSCAQRNYLAQVSLLCRAELYQVQAIFTLHFVVANAGHQPRK